MAEENISQVKEMIPDENCCFVLPPAPAAVSNGNVNMRWYSTGVLDKRVPPGGKAQGQTRYRGNQTSSTHDLCKHGKRREDELVIRPWKLVKNKKVEGGGGLVNGETLSVVMRKSLVSVSKPDKSLHVAKKDPAAVVSEVVKSCDGLRAKISETKSTTTTPSDSASGVRMVKKTNVDVKKVSKSSEEDVLKNIKDKEKKTKIDDVLEKKVSRIMEKKSSKEDLLKNVKRKEKTEIDKLVRCDDVLEKTWYAVVASSIEEKKKKKSVGSVKSETLKRSDPRPPIRQITSRPKAIPSPGLPTRPVSFKKRRLFEPKTEDPTLTSIKFKKRVVQEPKLISDVNKNKKNLKDRGEGDKKMSYNNSDEGKQEKVVLRHRKVEEKKKMGTLFNNVIEETVNKLVEERKSRVKALVGAFETVISLQDNDKTSLLKKKKKKKIQNKSISSQVVEG
ncbi:hypothetical protein F2Q70_00007199 [Brassica cretica]|uniref:Calmodulin-binding domain-containing protein n=1 Tax=Brassica cretica TaxID=69181 RepID=A0A8S9JIQ0_BRACR|nr:hypothetical protein F2Q68_00000225 [Brassica cretica]KAF2614387.1 hypothetical protein F2Q70_00007199 [Brassica cretica]